MVFQNLIEPFQIFPKLIGDFPKLSAARLRPAEIRGSTSLAEINPHSAIRNPQYFGPARSGFASLRRDKSRVAAGVSSSLFRLVASSSFDLRTGRDYGVLT
jgi:hypothetical protein